MRQIPLGPIALGLCMGLAITGCDDNASSRAQILRAHGTPVVADSLSGPGAPLGDGFSVPRGASLIGAVLPDDPSTGYPGLEAKRSWSALLVVTGDAAAVADKLLEQAARKGMRGTQSSCAAPGRCFAGAASLATVGAFRVPRRALDLGLGDPASLMAVSFRDLDPAALDAPVVSGPPVDPIAGDPQARVAAPERRERLPAVGDVIHLAPDGATDIHVMPRSTPLAPWICGRCFGRDVLLMRVTRGKELLAAYAAKVKGLDAWEGSGGSSAPRDGWNVRSFDFNNTDTHVRFELFQRAGRPDYLRLTLSNGA